jgi:hypothetical protein
MIGPPEADALGGSPPAFTGDQLELPVALPDDEWLDDSVLFDRIDEFLQVFVAEDGARLERGGNDLGKADELHPLPNVGGGSGGDDRGWWPGRNQRAKSFAECSFCHRTDERRGRTGERQTPRFVIV